MVKSIMVICSILLHLLFLHYCVVIGYVEATYMAINGWMGKENMFTRQYNSALKKKKILLFMNDPGGHFAKWSKPDIEGKIVCDFTYMTNWK